MKKAKVKVRKLSRIVSRMLHPYLNEPAVLTVYHKGRVLHIDSYYLKLDREQQCPLFAGEVNRANSKG